MLEATRIFATTALGCWHAAYASTVEEVFLLLHLHINHKFFALFYFQPALLLGSLCQAGAWRYGLRGLTQLLCGHRVGSPQVGCAQSDLILLM